MSLKYFLCFLTLFVIVQIAGADYTDKRTPGSNKVAANEARPLPVTDSHTYPCTGPQPEYFRCPQKNGNFPHPKNCSLYYSCVNYCAFEQECTAPRRYNAVQNTCKYMTTSQFCVKPPRPLKGELVDTFERMDDQFLCTRDGVFPHPDSCEKYYSCMNAVPYLYTCRDKLFDTRFNSCNYPELTSCEGGRRRPDHLPGTVTPPPTTTTTAPVYQCRETHYDNKSYYYRAPEDCAKFFVCLNGIFIFSDTCKNNTLFDEKISGCNFKWAVDCNVYTLL